VRYIAIVVVDNAVITGGCMSQKPEWHITKVHVLFPAQ